MLLLLRSVTKGRPWIKNWMLIVIAGLALSSPAFAQDGRTDETLDKLRHQLMETQTKEETLRLRSEQLEDDLKPENIERAFAGIGSTRPEELREHRRRMLTIERDSVLVQLKTLEATRLRLEESITKAEGRAYQESAAPTPPTQMLSSRSSTVLQILPLFALGLVGALALTVLTIIGAVMRGPQNEI